MNKKAKILTEDVLQTIIVVIALLLIFWGTKTIYDRYKVDEASESAKTLASQLQAKIQAFQESEINTLKITLQGINSEAPWYISGWDRTKNPRPDKCFLDSCICISPEATPESCQSSKGFDRKIIIDKITVKTITAKEVKEMQPTDEGKSTLSPTGDYIECIFPNQIAVKNKIYEFQLEKKENELIITNYDEEYINNKDSIINKTSLSIKQFANC